MKKKTTYWSKISIQNLPIKNHMIIMMLAMLFPLLSFSQTATASVNFYDAETIVGNGAFKVQNASCVCSQGYANLSATAWAEKSFVNPLPIGAVVTSVDYTLYGTNCSAGTANVELNGVAIKSVGLTAGCNCGDCYNQTFTVTGSSNYEYCTNTIRMQGTAGAMIPSHLDMVIHYTVTGSGSIQTSALAKNTICAGEAFDVNFSQTGTFNAGNIYSVQLSDANGNFSSPTVIGSVSGTTPVTVPAIMPVGVANGTKYKVRVVSSNPSLIGCNNGADISISDVTPPTIATLSAISVNTDAGVCTYASSQLTKPTAADNCKVSSIVATPGSLVIGANTVTWTVTDGSGLKATSAQTVTVIDNVKPTAISKNITVQLNAAGSITVNASQLNNGSTDNCGINNYKFATGSVGTVCNVVGEGSFLALNAPAGSVFKNILYASFGNSTGICGSFVNGSCNASNSLSLVSAAFLNKNSGIIYSSNDTFGDPCNGTQKRLAVQASYGPATTEVASITYTCADIGVKNVVLFVTDNSGNISSVNATITVEDKISPTITCATPAASYNSDPGICSYKIKDNSLNPVVTDNCSVASILNNYTNTATLNGATFPVGTTAVIWTAKDASGNTSTCNYNVVVVDAELPEVLTKDFTTQLDVNGNVTIQVSDIDDNSSDNCGIQKIELDKIAFTCANVGLNTVTLKVTDIHNNVASATAIVTVEDKVLPVVVTKDITVQLDASGNATLLVSDIDDNSSDNCGIKISELDITSFTCANIGANTVTLKITDNNDNVASTTAIVTVEDKVAPVVLAKDFTAQLDASGNATIQVSDIDNGSSDNCGIDTIELDLSTFTCANVGTNNVTLKVTDIHGNISSATAIVTVEDKVLPVVLTKDITVQLDASGSVTIQVSDIENVSSDNCGIDTIELDKTTFTCANVGSNTVTLKVTDIHNNVSLATATVIVEDKVLPVVLAKDITVQLDASGNATIQASDIDGNSSDNCGIQSIEIDKTSFTCANIGSNTVTLKVTDHNGNFDTKNAIVIIEDKVAPNVVTKDITVQLDAAGNATIQASDIDDNSTDNCEIATIELDKTSFTCANVGPNTVTLKVTDRNGNLGTKEAIVTVENKITPIISTKNVTIQLNNSGTASIVAADVDNGSTFACGTPTLTVSPSTFTCANIGINTVTLTATDTYGNISSKTATITIQDKIAATVLTKDFTVQLDATGNAAITAAQIDNGSSDLCGIASITVAPNTFSCTTIGANLVTLTVTDVNGNKSSATATVTVQDNILPIAKTKDLTVELDDAGNASITANQINNASSDNCGLASITVDKLSFNCSNVGINTVVLTVKDKAGNTAVATAKVTVVNKFGDNDNDGIPDNCDNDDDNDGIPDTSDNCPITANPYQEDRNNNGIGDACDKDQMNISQAFTPNGDGINDTWVISNIENHPNSIVRVFNRWGTEVFVARNYQNNWDGHYKGNSSTLPESSSYYYQIDLDGDGAIDKEGWIYINR